MVLDLLGCQGQLRQVDDPKAGRLPEKAPEGWWGLVCRTRAQCYKTFYNCNLPMFVISQSVCPWQAFLAYSIVCGKVRSLPLGGTPARCFIQEGSSLTSNHQTSARPVVILLRALDQCGKACQGQTLQLIMYIIKLQL